MGLLGILDERLVQQADVAIEFVDFTLDDFLHDVGRFTGHLGPINLAFPLNERRWNLFTAPHTKGAPPQCGG